MEMDSDEDDDLPGCEYCVDKPCSPGLAWRVFYKQGFNLRDSFCINRNCEDPAWNEEDEDETEEVKENNTGENKYLEKSEFVEKDLYNNSEKSESPHSSANAPLSSSSCLSSNWGWVSAS